MWRQSGTTQTDEHCRLDVGACGVSLEGTVLGAQNGTPVHVRYRVLAGADGVTTTVHVCFQQGLGRDETTLVRAPGGRWTVDGVDAPVLDGCTDVDLGCTPATNTLPIRRLRLEVGSSRTIRAAWVRFPELSVAAVDQTYTRLDEDTFRYASGSYAGKIAVDDLGLVTTYEEWQRTGGAEPGREPALPTSIGRGSHRPIGRPSPGRPAEAVDGPRGAGCCDPHKEVAMRLAPAGVIGHRSTLAPTAPRCDGDTPGSRPFLDS